MIANQIIEIFTNVVKEQDYLFDDVSISEIKVLQEQLKKVGDQSSEQIAKVIRQWYINYPTVRDAVFKAETATRAKINPKTTKPESQEETKENQIRILEKELEKLKNKLHPQK